MRERRSLQDRPWEEDLLHWAKDGTLHGHVTPPSDGRRRSITADGWCPGWALELQRKYLASSFGPGVPDEGTDADRDDPGRPLA
ncbi:hypothetical protein [Microlunatus antarcticus]|uniref:Uncharacterized protein n=1 Tax=Microlunatus antarcticus TaxID=53388 RepID=A0A7W5JZ32_9ACTN|nr:hypothetical protein [Microlunatus antarcticus]MBB3328977.1 hypothetical protein [Microlunatus antarcticus]